MLAEINTYGTIMTQESGPVELSPVVMYTTKPFDVAAEMRVHAFDAPDSMSEHVLGRVRSMLPDTVVSLRNNHHENGALDMSPPPTLSDAFRIGRAVSRIMTGVESDPLVLDVTDPEPVRLVPRDDGTWHRKPFSSD